MKSFKIKSEIWLRKQYIDILFCPLISSVVDTCDIAIGELLATSPRLIGRCRLVVQKLLARPYLLSDSRVLPIHGMQTYRKRVHPANRIPEELRSSIFSCLDMALRADPSAADGVVTYKLYDPEVNTYGKMRDMIHRMLTLQLGEENVGSLGSSSFERLLGEYLDERDGRLSFARHDHNVCTHCRELEIAAHTLELELKLMSPTIREEIRSVCAKQCASPKQELDMHISLDRRIREHLGRIVDAFKKSENQYRADVLSSGNTRMVACPKWNLLPPRNGLLTHADDMSAINIPHFVLNSVSELTRFAYSVNAHVSPITGNATVFSVEQGEGPHDSSSVFEKVLLDHFLTCRGERIKVVWSDCASVGRSYASCVAVPQFLVDSGFCDLCLIGFMANCHGTWHCDSLFGIVEAQVRAVPRDWCRAVKPAVGDQVVFPLQTNPDSSWSSLSVSWRGTRQTNNKRGGCAHRVSP